MTARQRIVVTFVALGAFVVGVILSAPLREVARALWPF